MMSVCVDVTLISQGTTIGVLGLSIAMSEMEHKPVARLNLTAADLDIMHSATSRVWAP